jgi:inner membrane protein
MALAAALPERESFDKVAWFSRGFYMMQEADDAILARDLRMGVEPDYFFSFQLARRNSEEIAATPPVRHRTRRDWSGLSWVWRRIFDESAVRDE